jgi:hypothetical protein
MSKLSRYIDTTTGGSGGSGFNNKVGTLINATQQKINFFQHMK